jgi:hypothetical protein
VPAAAHGAALRDLPHPDLCAACTMGLHWMSDTRSRTNWSQVWQPYAGFTSEARKARESCVIKVPPEMPYTDYLVIGSVPHTYMTCLLHCENVQTPKMQKWTPAKRWWLTPVILATQETEIRRITVQSQTQKQFTRPYLEKTHHKKGLVEWLKV